MVQALQLICTPDAKSGRPPTALTQVPGCLLSWLYPFTVLPLKARSVPDSSAMCLRCVMGRISCHTDTARLQLQSLLTGSWV